MGAYRVENASYMFSFGIDIGPVGPFFSIWEKAAEGEDYESDAGDCYQIHADSYYGLLIFNRKTLERNTKLAELIKPLEDAPPYKDEYNGREITLKLQALRNEETVIAIGAALGFQIDEQVHELWE